MQSLSLYAACAGDLLTGYTVMNNCERALLQRAGHRVLSGLTKQVIVVFGLVSFCTFVDGEL